MGVDEGISRQTYRKHERVEMNVWKHEMDRHFRSSKFSLFPISLYNDHKIPHIKSLATATLAECIEHMIMNHDKENSSPRVVTMEYHTQ